MQFDENEPLSLDLIRATKRQKLRESPSQSLTRESTPGNGRAGAYNPECDLADLSSGDPHSNASFAGHLSSPHLEQDVVQDEEDLFTRQESRRRLQWLKKHSQTRNTPKISEPQRRYLEHEGAFAELPRTTTDALLPIYLSLFNDLIPVLDGEKVVREFSNGNSSIHLVKAICLVACKAKQARPFLKIAEDGPVLTHQEFAAALLAALDAAIKSHLEPDNMVKIQMLALLHLYNDGPGGAERSSGYLSQAISEAWAMYLHLKITGLVDEEERWFLWWSLRNLDRLNKPVMGSSPFMIDDADVSTPRVFGANNSYRKRVITVSLALGDLTASATRLYKASYTTRKDDTVDFPSLSEITAGVRFDQFHSLHRVYLELWYHVVAMLSCRFNGPESAQYDRRLRSADWTIDMISQHLERIPPLPLLPYAMAMATTVIFRALHDQVRDIKKALPQLELCYQTLYALSQSWTSARGVLKITRRLLRGLAECASTTFPADDSGGQANIVTIPRNARKRGPEASPEVIAGAQTMDLLHSSALSFSDDQSQLESDPLSAPHLQLNNSLISWTESPLSLDLAFSDIGGIDFSSFLYDGFFSGDPYSEGAQDGL